MGLVNFNEIIEHEEETVDGIMPTQSASEFVLAKRVEKLNDVVAAIEDDCNQSIHFVTDGSFSMHDLLIKLMPNLYPCSVWIATYAITELPARILADMVAEGKISKLYILGDRRIRERYPAVEQLISNVSEIKTTQIHGKVLVIKSGNKYLTVLGSANWTTNPRIELAIADKCPDVAKFHIDWITKKMKDGDLFE